MYTTQAAQQRPQKIERMTHVSLTCCPRFGGERRDEVIQDVCRSAIGRGWVAFNLSSSVSLTFGLRSLLSSTPSSWLSVGNANLARILQRMARLALERKTHLRILCSPLCRLFVLFHHCSRYSEYSCLSRGRRATFNR